MDDTGGLATGRGRSSFSRADSNPHPSLYRLNSNQSSSSVFEDVEMAQEEVRILLRNMTNSLHPARSPSHG